MATIEKQLLGSQLTLLSTELNSLANNSLAISSVGGTSGVFNNTVSGGSMDGYLYCDLELVVTFGVAPTDRTGITVWLLRTQDGTNFEDGSSSVTPYRLPDITFTVRAVTTAQRIIRPALLPPGNWMALLKNDGTGQALAASGNTLKVRPVTYEGV